MVTALAPTNRISTNGHAKKPAKPKEMAQVPTLDRRQFAIQIVGTTPLIVHAFSADTHKAIADKQQKKAKVARAARDPHAEYLGCFYMMPGSPPPLSKGARYGIPASGFRKAIISACRYLGDMTMTFAKGAVFVLDDGGGMVELDASEPKMRTDTVRIGVGGTLDLRYRPEFEHWQCRLRVEYNHSIISPEQIINMFHHAGFHVGWGEWRPEKGGSNGMFEVRTAAPEKTPKSQKAKTWKYRVMNKSEVGKQGTKATRKKRQ